MINYGWLITKDWMPDESAPEGTNLNAKGMVGPRGIPDHIEEELRSGAGQRFRIIDEDDNKYYDGLVIALDDAIDDNGDPLTAFGAPNAGATTLLVKEDNGRPEWTVVF